MSHPGPDLDRRTLIAATAAGAATPAFAGPAPAGAPPSQPFPLEAVRLLDSPFSRSVEVNRAYMLSLSPDRLLHNFRLHAGLAPKGEVYGGWESDTIAGHTLGHYLSALALLHAQTGDPEAKQRVRYITAELAACQAASGDGYVGGFLRKRPDGELEDGRAIFAEIRAGDIRATNFDLNGAWSPLYNVHKTLAGLLDAHRYCREPGALEIAAGVAGYLEGVFGPLGDDQMQQVMACEFGGLQESLAEIHARTRNPRWLRLAARFDHRAVIDPLAAGRDELEGLHANTQVPKAVAWARMHELTGDARQARAARFFWRTVTGRRSYVIGGNADREYFEAPDTISTHITEQTCETCNSYNMLKLTRALHGWQAQAACFDFYERALYNHILAHQHPGTGMMAYMVPLMSGEARAYSRPFDDFWCCVGTGMESHSKYGDSVWWRRDEGVAVNLYIPSALDWTERGRRLELTGTYPWGEHVELRVARTDGRAFPLFLRIPAWCASPRLQINGRPATMRPAGGYLTIRRAWKAGDVVGLVLPMSPRLEPTADDPSVVAILNGPLVLAADLGPAAAPYAGPDPAMVGADLLAALEPDGSGGFRTRGAGRPRDLLLRPFHALHDRRTAVYFNRFTEAEWEAELARRATEAQAMTALDARSIDVIRLGEEADERAHGLEQSISYPVSYRRRPGRDARAGGFFQFRARVRAGEPAVLRAAYWGEERNRAFRILVDGAEIARQILQKEAEGRFIERDYPIPAALTAGKSTVLVRFEPEPRVTAGPVFGCRILAG